MFLLKTVKPEEATGEVAKAYGVFPKEVGVPAPMQLASASPARTWTSTRIWRASTRSRRTTST